MGCPRAAALGTRARRAIQGVDRDSALTVVSPRIKVASEEITGVCNSPQAKRRVERAYQTLQDRLVRELRLRGISTPDEANRLAPSFITDYNL